MEKKKYVKPSTEDYRLLPESLMINASPGVSNDEFDPTNDEVGAKENWITDEPEGGIKRFNAWED